MLTSIFEFFSRYLPPEIFIFITGAVAGGYLCRFFYSGYWEFRAKQLTWQREDAEKERQRQETQAELVERKATEENMKQRRIQAMEGLFYNSGKQLTDSAENIYCTECMKSAERVLCHGEEIGRIIYYHCPQCGREN